MVISIDPAGGGQLSDEVFVVFMVADDQSGLLTARVVPGHNREFHGFSLVPIVFVISLLHTIVQVRDLLKRAHHSARWNSTPKPKFSLPPVLVLIEPETGVRSIDNAQPRFRRLKIIMRTGRLRTCK